MSLVLNLTCFLKLFLVVAALVAILSTVWVPVLHASCTMVVLISVWGSVVFDRSILLLTENTCAISCKVDYLKTNKLKYFLRKI